MPAVSSVGEAKRFGHHFAHAALVNIAHGENVHAGFFHQAALLGVELANAHQHDVARLDHGLDAGEFGESGGP